LKFFNKEWKRGKMAVKKNVFPSKSERKNFYLLSRTWGDRFNIYQNLPFLNVFDWKNLFNATDLTNFELSEIDQNRLKKTSIDFTLCDKRDNPILCIEFDGLQDGFNVGEKYYPGKINKIPNPWRTQITELKLKVALGSMFPYFVVGYQPFQEFKRDFQLTIVDGIIGEVLANKYVQREVSEFSVDKTGFSEEEFDQLSEFDKHEVIQDWLFGVEITGEMENNPIAKKRSQLHLELNANSWTSMPLNYPAFEPSDIDGYNARILAGYKVIYHTEDLGDVHGEVLLPHFNVPYYSGYVTEEIAGLLALQRIQNMRSLKKEKHDK